MGRTMVLISYHFMYSTVCVAIRRSAVQSLTGVWSLPLRLQGGVHHASHQKSGVDLTDSASYRPISNLSVLSKTRPRRRRLEAFTTDAKIIRLISRRVAIFPTAATRQIFDGDCDAANRKKISGVILPNFRPCGFLDEWTEVFPVDMSYRPIYTIALTVSSLFLK